MKESPGSKEGFTQSRKAAQQDDDKTSGFVILSAAKNLNS